MGNEESGVFEEGGEIGELQPRGGRRAAGGGADDDFISNRSKYDNYDASSSSSSRRRGGRRGHAGGSSGDDNHGYNTSTDKLKSPASSSAKGTGMSVKTGDDDIFSGLNLPLGETPKSISNKGRKAFNQAIWSPRGGDSKQSKAPKITNNNSASQEVLKKAQTSEETKPAKAPEPEKPTFNFDSLYYSQAKSTSVKKETAEMDDDLFSNPFGVSSSSTSAPKEIKSRSINVDVKMGNAALKAKVRGDRRRKQQKKRDSSSTFHRPNSDMMYDAFDDLEEEMIGDGVIGNGNKRTDSGKVDIDRRSSVAKPKQLQWSASHRSSGRGRDRDSGYGSSNRSRDRDMGGDEDGWF